MLVTFNQLSSREEINKYSNKYAGGSHSESAAQFPTPHMLLSIHLLF
jgi:hypothetical protein